MRDIVPPQEEDSLKNSNAALVVMKGVIRCMESGEHTLRPSEHRAHELTYVRKGALKYIIKGKEYPLQKGGIFVLKPNVEHTYIVSDGPADLLVVYFGFTHNAETEQEAGELVSSVSIDQFIEFAGEEEAGKPKEAGFYLRGKGRERVAALAEECLSESRGDAFGKRMMLDALAVELVIEVCRNIKAAWEENLKVKQGKARELVLIAKNYIDEHYAENISVADAANYVFLSQGYFARAFRDELSMSPMAYLIHLRVEKACELLRGQRDLKVSAIAGRVGFSSPQRFNAAFRKQMGMTPMEYRKTKPSEGKGFTGGRGCIGENGDFAAQGHLTLLSRTFFG